MTSFDHWRHLQRHEGWLSRASSETVQMLAIAAKDIRVYYLTPPMLMFGLLMPFFMFFSFSIGRSMTPEMAISRLLAVVSFFTASSVGPVVIPVERRARTYDRLLVAPVSLVAVLLGKSIVGAVYGMAVAAVSLILAIAFLHVSIVDPLLLAVTLVGGTMAFSVMGVVFASIPTQSPIAVMMPSTLVRWPLLFISGVFIPLPEMMPWVRAVSYASPVTYSQDLINHAVSGTGVLGVGLDLASIPISLAVFLALAIKLHDIGRNIGY
jgi:ABC-2 type transport system permease protein